MAAATDDLTAAVLCRETLWPEGVLRNVAGEACGEAGYTCT